MTDRSVADELEGEVEVEELGELGGEVHREALEPVVPRQLLLRLHQHRVRRVLNNKNKNKNKNRNKNKNKNKNRNKNKNKNKNRNKNKNKNKNS
jgi:hypothetical protein